MRTLWPFFRQSGQEFASSKRGSQSRYAPALFSLTAVCTVIEPLLPWRHASLLRGTPAQALAWPMVLRFNFNANRCHNSHI
jgi:hypothetical protein